VRYVNRVLQLSFYLQFINFNILQTQELKENIIFKLTYVGLISVGLMLVG